MNVKSTASRGIFKPGINCKSVDHANRASVIIDGEEYFSDLKRALESAEKQIVFVGWDFDTRVSLQGGADGQSLRDFITSLLRRKKSLQIYILKWNFGALKILFRGRMIFTIARWMMSNRLRLKFDGVHPIGASHHQKLVVIDGSLAFCGGIDATSGRWDTREHIDSDPRRVTPDGDDAEPWHDLSMVFDGAAAQRAHEVASERWRRATGKSLPQVGEQAEWPFLASPTFEDIPIAIARTRGEHKDATSNPRERRVVSRHDRLGEAQLLRREPVFCFAAYRRSDCTAPTRGRPPGIRDNHAEIRRWLAGTGCHGYGAQPTRGADQKMRSRRTDSEFIIRSPVAGRPSMFMPN